MRKYLRNFSGLLLVSLVLSLSLPALAGESQEHFDLATFLGQVLNFVVLFGGLALLLRKPLNDYLKGKADQVAARLRQSEDLKEESLQKLQQSRARLDNLEAEIRALREEAEREASRERQMIKQEAEKEAQRLRKLAQEEIEALFRASLRELKAYAIDLSVALAEKRIREKLTPELHRKLIHQAIDRLRSLHESSVDS
ncbi:MAG: ATP synthase F0 subunit B [Candidatus Aminicenantes bacterium]|nr:ATP synthase F0 subunit B [Candidatus Aminicenantes bacterium]